MNVPHRTVFLPLLISLPVSLLAPIARAQPALPSFVSVADLLTPQTFGDPWLRLPTMIGARCVDGESMWNGQPTLERWGPFEWQEDQPIAPPFYEMDALVGLLSAYGHEKGSDYDVIGEGHTLLLRGAQGEAMAATLAFLRQRLPPIVHIDVALQREIDGTATSLLQRQVDVRSGWLQNVSVVRESTAVVDFDVEIAQAVSAANPIVVTTQAGAMVTLRPTVSPLGDAVRIESLTRVVAARPDTIDTGYAGIGPIDRDGAAVATMAGASRCQLGDELVQRWRGADGAAYVLTLRPTWQLKPAVGPDRADFEYVLLPAPFAGFRTGVQSGQGDSPEPIPSPTEEILATLGLPAIECGSESDARVVLGDAAALARRAAGAWFDRDQPAPTFAVTVLDVPAGAEVGRDGAAPAGARTLGSATLSIVGEQWATVQVFDEQGCLNDWDIEVAQAARIPDPKCRRTSHGLWLDVRHADGRLQLRGEYVPERALRRQELTLSLPVDTPRQLSARGGGSGSSGYVSAEDLGAFRLMADEVVVEHPVRLAAAIVADLTLPADPAQAATARSRAGDVLAADRELLVVARRVAR